MLSDFLEQDKKLREYLGGLGAWVIAWRLGGKKNLGISIYI
jgi:hypothetical protein